MKISWKYFQNYSNPSVEKILPGDKSMSDKTPKTSVVNVKKQFLNKRGFKDFEDWAKSENKVYIGRNMSRELQNPSGLIRLVLRNIQEKNVLNCIGNIFCRKRN